MNIITFGIQEFRKERNPRAAEIKSAFFKACVLFTVLVGLIFAVPHVLMAYNVSLGYQLEYVVTAENVGIEPEPHGCAYDDVPLGNKYCHFEKQVVLVSHTYGVPGSIYSTGSDWTAGTVVTGVFVTWNRVDD